MILHPKWMTLVEFTLFQHFQDCLHLIGETMQEGNFKFAILNKKINS